MRRADLEYWDKRGLHFNEGAPPPEPRLIRVAPYPAPLVLGERQHDGERLVYESFVSSAPELAGFAAYSMPLPHSGNRRIEADFVALMPRGVALVEVKGGIVQVNSRPGPGVRWAHYTRSGNPTGGHVTPSQLYRVTDSFSIMAQAMAGVALGTAIAQLMVFPHTSRDHVSPDVLARLDSPNRDFLRIVFAEDLAQFGMWRLIDDELHRPGRRRDLNEPEVTNLARWIMNELDVQPGPAPAPAGGHRLNFSNEIPLQPGSHIPRNDLTHFARSPASLAQSEQMFTGIDRFLERTRNVGSYSSSPTSQPKPASRSKRQSSFRKIAIGLAFLVAGGIWLGRSNTPAPVSAPALAPPAPPSTASSPSSASNAPARPIPTPDPFQAALTKAVGEPEKRIAAGGNDWVRVLGPVTGRPGCQLAEISYSGKITVAIACRDGERGVWRY
jgi:hypothetical protein